MVFILNLFIISKCPFNTYTLYNIHKYGDRLAWVKAQLVQAVNPPMNIIILFLQT